MTLFAPKNAGSVCQSSLIIFATLVLGGCGRDSSSTLTVATAWPAADRSRVESAFRASAPSARIRWLLLSESDDPARLARRRMAPDLILGAPASTLVRLEHEGSLEPAIPGRVAWSVVRRVPFAVATNPKAKVPRDLVDKARLKRTARSLLGLNRPTSKTPRPTDPPFDSTFDDPRNAGSSLARMKGILETDGWARGYARLVREADGVRPPGRQQGSSLAAVERGDGGRTVTVDAPANAAAVNPIVWSERDDTPGWTEGVGVLRGTPRMDLARTFVATVAERDGAVPAVENPEADGLLADLLGATLVDAHDELRDAWSVLRQAGHPEKAERWMAEAPPWPPASVVKLLGRETNAMAMMNTLAAQLAPEADTRAWLVRGWLAPERRVDATLLDELARADGGRLAREPRFRAWLRGEWTAWARQRYRRVARLASEGGAS